MNNEEKDINNTEVSASNDETTTPGIENQEEALARLQEDIIRNDTIPETKRNTPGSNGAYPVGAFDTSKDYTKE